MALKDWKKTKETSTHIEYKRKNTNKGIHIIRRYPSGEWDIEAFEGAYSSFGEGLPQYHLTKQKALKLMKEYVKKH